LPASEKANYDDADHNRQGAIAEKKRGAPATNASAEQIPIGSLLDLAKNVR